MNASLLLGILIALTTLVSWDVIVADPAPAPNVK
jgi:hypothetical protein